METTITRNNLEGSHSGAISILRMGHATGVQITVVVVSARRGKNSFQDHKKILSSEAEA